MPSYDEMIAHGYALNDALIKYEERDKVHKGLWKQDEPHELAALALHKVKRLLAQTEQPPDPYRDAQIEDDALDLINYAAFVIRRVRGE